MVFFFVVFVRYLSKQNQIIMKNGINISVIAILIIMSLGACQKDYDRCLYGDSFIVQEFVPLHRVDKIEISGEITVELRQGVRNEIFYDMPENYIHYFNIDQRGRTLRISKNRCFVDDYLLVITVRELETIELYDEARLVIPDDLRARYLDIYMDENSEIDAAFSVDELTLDMRESSYAKLFGEVLDLEIERYGDGEIDALDMTSDYAEVEHYGSSDVNISVIKELEASIFSSGSIYVLGTPELDTTIAGTGNVVLIN